MNKLIAELVEGERVSGQFLLSNFNRGVNNLGSAYYSLELKDSSGMIVGKKWEVSSQDEQILVIGNVILVEGETLKYKDNLQLKILNIAPVDQDSVDVSRFLAKPPIPREELEKKFNDLVGSIKDEDCLKLVQYFVKKYEDKIFTHPAGVSVHHDYMSGLLMHITSMAEVATFLAKQYNADRDLLVTGALLHDIGKLIELEGKYTFHYSTEGKLLGHISIMVSELKNAAKELGLTSEVPLLLEHMVLSHHDKPEFGSPIPPCTKEALLLSMIDNMDSKMCIVDKALAEVAPGEFSNKVFPLDGRCLYKRK